MRSYYKLAIILFAILAIDQLYHSIIRYQLGSQIYELDYYPTWMIGSYLLDLLTTLILLKYFHHKKFRAAFSTLIVVAIASLFHYGTSYTWIMGRTWGTIDIVSFLLILTVGLAFSIVLVVSNTKTRPYLKRLGVICCVYVPIVMGFYIYAISSTGAGNPTMALIYKWLEIIGSFILTLYIFNFLSELKETPQANTIQTV